MPLLSGRWLFAPLARCSFARLLASYEQTGRYALEDSIEPQVTSTTKRIAATSCRGKPNQLPQLTIDTLERHLISLFCLLAR